MIEKTTVNTILVIVENSTSLLSGGTSSTFERSFHLIFPETNTTASLAGENVKIRVWEATLFQAMLREDVKRKKPDRIVIETELDKSVLRRILTINKLHRWLDDLIIHLIPPKDRS